MNLTDDLYQDIILGHYRSKKFKRRLETPPALAYEGTNPSCGDEVEIFIEVDNTQTIKEITYEGAGCSICIASANMLCDALTGRSLEDAKILFDSMRQMLVNGEEVEFPDYAGDLQALEGVKKFPVRIKCALLAWSTLNTILSEHLPSKS